MSVRLKQYDEKRWGVDLRSVFPAAIGIESGVY